MVDAKAFLAYVGIAGFLIVGSHLICDEDLPDQSSASWLSKLASFLTFGGCSGLPDWWNFLTVLIIGGGAVFLIASLTIPVLAGAAANPIVGTIIAAALIAGIVLAVAGLLLV